MSPNNINNNRLTTDGIFQSTGYTFQDGESQYEWVETTCILLESGRFIAINDFGQQNDLVELREFDYLDPR